MTVRAKFVVSAKEQSFVNVNEIQTTIKMRPVYGGSPENEKFFKYTPGGHVELAVLPVAVADQFELGKEYYLDFTPAA